MKRVVVVDDHPIICDAMTMALTQSGMDAVGTTTVRGGLRACESHRPDLLILDLSFPNGSGLALLRTVVEEGLAPAILVFSAHADATYPRMAFAAGADAFLVKGAPLEVMMETARSLVRKTPVQPTAFHRLRPDEDVELGEQLLTERHREILGLAALGAAPKAIAMDLGIAVKTVHNHLGEIYRRLDVQSLTQAIIAARKLDLLRAGDQLVIS